MSAEKAMEQVSLRSNGIWQPTTKEEDGLFEEDSKPSDSWIVSVDGVYEKITFHHEGIIKGDTFSLAIAMGSLIAKVTRDREMKEISKHFPMYDFSSNKGYGSPKHLRSLDSVGPCIHHRPRFLRNILNTENTDKSKIQDQQSQLSFF